ncbi:MAG: TIGR03545 family protein [Pirellulales bacterium]
MERGSGAIGWRHVLPWTLGFLGLFAVAHFVLAWAIQREVVDAGQRRVGSRVEIGDTRVTLVGSRASLSDIRVANPLAPMRNLIEADQCFVQLDSAALLRKQAVVRYGVVSGIRFGTTRDTSGELPNVDLIGESNDDDWLDESSAKQAQEWLDRLHQRFDRSLVDQLESIRLADELLARWPDQSAALESRIAELRNRTSEFHTQVRDAQENPLRHVEFLKHLPREISRIREQVASLSGIITELPSLAEEDRKAIVAARAHDEKLLHEELQFESIDPNVLSAYLLQKQLNGPLADVVGWLRVIRRIVPAEPKTVSQRRHRGREIIFTGCHRQPDLLIQQLQLAGSANFAGAPLDFTGTLVDVTDEPARHDRPIRLRLKTQGSMPLEIAATIDRTQKVARDQLCIDCGSLKLPTLSLGGSKKFRLSLSPTTATLKVRITLDGDQLSGSVELSQRQVQITPTVGRQLARHHFDAELAAALAKIDTATTRISLGGTLDGPTCDVHSNLGPAVAAAFERALAAAAANYTQQLLAESHSRVDERLALLDQQIADAQTALEPQLADTVDNLDQLAKKTNGERLSVDQLGRRLPDDSLFR